MTYRAPETNDSAPLAQQIEQMIDELPGEQVSVGTLLSALGDEGLLLIVILLSAIFIIPVSIPGLSTVFGASILLIGLSRVRNRPLWVPQKLARREIATDKLKANLGRALKWVHRMERLSRPMRLAVMVRSKKMMRLNNLMLVFATLLLMAPAGPIPFSNTLPALALMSFAIGFIQHHNLDSAEVDMVLFSVINQTAGGADQNIDAAFQHFQLFVITVTAVGQAEFQAGGLCQWLCVSVDLYRQFSRRGHNQRARLVNFAVSNCRVRK